MQAIPLKRATKVDIIGPITKYLKKTQGKDIDRSVLLSLEKVQKQRDLVMTIQDYSSPNNIPDLKCYFSYLEQIEEIFPLTNNKVIDITFTWTDSFTSRKCSVPSIIYEKAAVLFNIAALYTKIAYNASNVENTTEECVVQAIDALRNAALYFSQLANEYSTRLLPMKVTGDLSSQALKTLKDVCIAQGQQMYYVKATVRNLSSAALLSLLKVASDDFNEVAEEAKKCDRYFPKPLIKHFELQSMLAAIMTFHYRGEVILKDESTIEQNAGELYCLAGAIEAGQNAVNELVRTFHLERSDENFIRFVYDLVKNDQREYYGQYRLYGGIVPNTPQLPNGVNKMELATDMQLTQIPLSFPKLAASPALTHALAIFAQERMKKQEEINKMAVDATHELQKLMCNCLLPDILTADDFSVGLPRSMESRLNAIRGDGSADGIMRSCSEIEAKYQNMNQLYQQLKPQVSYGSEYSDSMDWVRVTLGTFRSKLDELKEYSVKMNAKPLIFKDSISKLRESLPSCPNYPKNQGSSGIRNASDRAQSLLTNRRELLQSLMLSKAGEMILRGKVQGDKTALNVKTVVFEAMQPIIKDCQAIRNNLEQQSTVMKDVEVEYAQWNKSRSLTPEMKKREDALRDVNVYLNMYEEARDLCAVLNDTINVVESTLKDIQTKA